ncbi:hypothetical protein [Microbacterium sp. MPKO10]|uniref:hypothetical protein n=1 Tax=Microbacterium sp. MPKO10 TaxID=2989818 RepID=UPI002236BB77|nr:hypothetical protein [Microbacterium sp. MPKO10]MCW4458536.1 hypothetical protein [Microbacterium sp. MPKO10]
MTEQTAFARSPALVGQVAVWSLTLVLSVLAALLAPEGLRFAWISLACAIGVLAAFVRELSVHEKDGFIVRVAILCAGNAIIVSVVAGVAGLSELLTY